ncbi:angiopoietin-related protein 6 [Drosophila bipectinata]|uniref:angiopoietin-related protein 6 n=1 Tax=Drosophila bipectinata TaxID=42026 RepID=UPI001C8B0375|nr:angiopoietin-related protein 6 [Drosophila bipectinata]
MNSTWLPLLALVLLHVYVANGDIVEPETYKNYYSSCKALNPKKSGIQKIQVGQDILEVYCESKIAGRGWVVIQRRVSAEENFFRNWTSYENGFGNLKGNFFLGLKKIKHITTPEPQELYIHLEDFQGKSAYAYYDRFTLGDVYSNYSIIQLGAYTGTAGDSLSYHLYQPFSTFDRDNDFWPEGNCAVTYMGAWWYRDCLGSNLNGAYLGGNYTDSELFAKGVTWGSWHGFSYSYKTVTIMLRSQW